MVTLIVLFFAALGMFATGFTVWAFAGFQGSTLFSKEWKLLGYKLTVASTAGRELEIKLKKG